MRIELGQWPQNIRSLLAEYKVNVCYEDTSLDQCKDEWDGRHFILSAQYHLLNLPLVTEYPSSITIEIRISEVWGEDDRWVSVDESKWNKYDIIMNDSSDYL